MNRNIFAIVVIVAIAFVGFNSIYIVDEGQQTILTQFGEPIGETKTEAGLYFKTPFIQKVRYFDKRILKWDGDPNEIPTNDKKYIWVDTTARWRIRDPLQFLQRMSTISRATLRLNDLINGAVRDFVTKNDLAEIVRSSDWNVSFSSTTEQTATQKKVKVGRDKFSQLVLNNVEVVARDFGIELLDVLVKRVNYTQQVREKVYSRMISERQRIATQKRAEGEAKKAEILGDMDRQLKTITSQAYKTSQTIRGNADGKATAIYGKAYNKDPEFYAFFTTLQSYEATLTENTKLVIQADSQFYKYMKAIK